MWQYVASHHMTVVENCLAQAVELHIFSAVIDQSPNCIIILHLLSVSLCLFAVSSFIFSQLCCLIHDAYWALDCDTLDSKRLSCQRELGWAFYLTISALRMTAINCFTFSSSINFSFLSSLSHFLRYHMHCPSFSYTYQQFSPQNLGCEDHVACMILDIVRHIELYADDTRYTPMRGVTHSIAWTYSAAWSAHDHVF